MNLAIRAVNLKDRIAGGIIIPFRVRDKYRTWWDENSDIGRELFRQRPVFWYHLQSGKWLRSGTVLDESLRMTADGWYAEARITDEMVWQEIEANRAAWSTGSMPHLVQVREDGYVEKWAFVELSAAPKDKVGSLPGTTDAYALRAAGFDIEENGQIQRGIWVMDPEENGKTKELDVGAIEARFERIETVVDKVADTVEDMAEAVVSIRGMIENPPQQLPEGNPLEEERTPAFEVSSKYDRYTLPALLLEDKLRQLHSFEQREVHVRTEEFMRAVVDKARVLYELQKDEEQDWQINVKGVQTVPLRAVDDEAFAVWNKHVPYLRADEAMKSTLANKGDELVPTLLDSTLYWYIRLQSRVASLLPTIQMASQPFDVPVITSWGAVRKAAELADQNQLDYANSVFVATQIGTDKVTFSAGKVGALLVIAEELFEDSNVDTAMLVSQALQILMAQAVDDVLLNGDEAATVQNYSHYGTDPTGTAYDKYLVLNGLRRIAVDNSDATAEATFDEDSPATVGKLMGARGIIGRDIKNSVMVLDPGVAWVADALDAYESLSDVGPQATLLTGQVGSLKGVPLVVSDELEYANVSGQVEDSHDGTKGTFLRIWRPGCWIGYKRGVRIEANRQPHTDGFVASCSVRLDVQAMQAGAVAYGYNVTV